MEFLLLLTAFADSGVGFLNKKLMTKGMPAKEYFYFVTLALVPLSALFFIIYPFDFVFSLSVILLLILSVIVRAINVVSFSTVLKTITPLTISIYSTFAVVITYTIDLLIGAILFDFWHIIAIAIIFLGTIFIVLKNKKLANGIRFVIVLRVLSEVLKGYIAYFILKEISNASFVFSIAVLTAIIILPFTKKIVTSFTPKKALQGFIVQIAGVCGLIFANILAASSATLYMLKAPTTLVLTLVLSYIIKKDVGVKPGLQELVGSLIVIVGLTLFSILQI